MSDLVSSEAIAGKIHVIRGVRVMLDRDLADLYDVETRIFNQAVKRNIKRFPDDFMFQLTRQEFDNLMSRIVTSSLGGVRKLPLAFTGQGVAMASSVLGSDRAIEVSLQIMRTFTHLRRLAEGHHELRRKIEDLETKYDRQFEVVFAALRQLPETDEKPPRKIGFTAKERQRGSAADRAVDFTPAARKRWDRLTPGLQAMFLANVWCRKCNGTTEMALGSGRIEKGQLVLHGNCAACGQTVARVIEQS